MKEYKEIKLERVIFRKLARAKIRRFYPWMCQEKCLCHWVSVALIDASMHFMSVRQLRRPRPTNERTTLFVSVHQLLTSFKNFLLQFEREVFCNKLLLPFYVFLGSFLTLSNHFNLLVRLSYFLFHLMGYPLGKVSLHGWSPVCQVWTQLPHYIVITTYQSSFLEKSNLVKLENSNTASVLLAIPLVIR